jgi:hypothetical protein
MDRELIKLIEENGLTLHGDFDFFAHLVAEREREACADFLEHGVIDDDGHHKQYAKEIRARGGE